MLACTLNIYPICRMEESPEALEAQALAKEQEANMVKKQVEELGKAPEAERVVLPLKLRRISSCLVVAKQLRQRAFQERQRRSGRVPVFNVCNCVKTLTWQVHVWPCAMA